MEYGKTRLSKKTMGLYLAYLQGFPTFSKI